MQKTCSFTKLDDDESCSTHIPFSKKEESNQDEEDVSFCSEKFKPADLPIKHSPRHLFEGMNPTILHDESNRLGTIVYTYINNYNMVQSNCFLS